MITDERLDQLIRSSLGWHAERIAPRQPTLRQATRQLAARVGPSATAGRPRVVMTMAPGNAARMMLTILLLLAMLAAVAYVGATLLDQRRFDLRPGPFGFAASCPTTIVPTTELHVELDGAAQTRLHAGGILVTDSSSPGLSRVQTVQQAFSEERRLTPRGRTLLLKRVTEAGLTPGCRSLRTERSTGQITALTVEGYVQVSWGPDQGAFRPARPITTAEEASLDNLARELLRPSDWLPDVAWADPEPSRGAPRQWLITVASTPTDYPPGARLGLSNGVTLDGFDPRYERVALPGGADLATFGEVLPYAPLQPIGGTIQITVRCASLDHGEALELAQSLDGLVLGADGWGDLFTKDLSMAIVIGLRPALPAGYDCQTLYEDERPDRALLPAPTPAVVGNLIHIDPCGLVPPDEPLLETLGVARQVEEVTYFGAAPSRTCNLIDTRDNFGETATHRYGYPRANLTLYPSTVTRTEANQIALGWLGDGTVEVASDQQVVWANRCAATGADCVRVYVAWSDGNLVGFEHAARRGLSGRTVDAATARSFVDAVMAQLEAR